MMTETGVLPPVLIHWVLLLVAATARRSGTRAHLRRGRRGGRDAGGGPARGRCLIVVVAGLLGLVVGSFLNVVIYRVPLRRSVVWPASRCPECGEAIEPKDNVPLLSYVLLRGRCRSCKARISARYL